MKCCTKCAVDKPLTAFHADKTRLFGVRDICKQCVSLHSKTYYKENKSKIIDRAKEWVEANRQRHNDKCKRWVRENRGAVNARTARRYAAKSRATPKWITSEENWLIKEIYSLASLRSKITGVRWEVDHIIPLRGETASGLHVPSNLQVVLMSHNRRKSNRLSFSMERK